MKLDSKRIIPPGFTFTLEGTFFWSGEALVLIIFLISAFSRLNHAVAALYTENYGMNRPPVLIPGAMLPDLWTLLHGAFNGLFIVLLCLPLLAAVHYLSYRRGSMSIYLMRRLPDRWLLHQQCLTLPLIDLLLYLLTALLLIGLFLLCYLHSAPAVCLPPAYRRFFV